MHEGVPHNSEEKTEEVQNEVLERKKGQENEFSPLEVLKATGEIENATEEEAAAKWDLMSDEERAKAVMIWESKK